MRHLRRLLAAAVLTFVLAGAALADDGIIYGGLAQPDDGIIHGDAPSAAPDGSTATPGDDATLTDAAFVFVRDAISEMLTLG